jgi:hypothetical protein
MITIADSANLSSSANIAFNAGILGRSIAEEIEYILPEIIQSLEIPIVLNSAAKQRLEFSLMGKRGFRALSKSERRQAIKRLKDTAFANILRNIQQIVSTERRSNSGCTIPFLDFNTSEGATLDSSRVRAATNIAYESVLSLETGHHEIIISSAEETTDSAALSAKGAPGDTASDMNEAQIATEKQPTFKVPEIPIELQEPIVGRDVRGLIALLRRGRLVGFVEELVGELLGNDLEKIHVPTKKSYRNLSLDQLIAEYHALSVNEDSQHDSDVSRELRLIDALLTAIENDEQWTRINRRRFHLINKEYSLGLSRDEAAELERLDELARQRMYMGLQLPFAELAMLEAYAASVGLPPATA